MRTTFTRQLALGTSAAIIGLVILACGVDEGERARSDGGCPVGETCSPHTPMGLRFRSTPLSDTIGALPTIATGGRATIGFEPIGGASLPAFEVEVEAGLDVLSAAAVDARRGTAEVAALAATSGSYLRVFAADESGLLDRVLLRAQPVARRGLRPYVGLLQSLGGPFEGGIWRYWSGASRLTVLATLHDAEGARLVDESLTMSASVGMPDGLPSDYERAWDVYPLDVADVASFSVSVGVESFALQATSEVDEVVMLPNADEGSLLRDGFACFVARVSGVPVLGAPLMAAWEGASPAPLGGEIDAFPFQDMPCVAIPEGTGTRRLTVSGPGGVERSFDVPLVAAGAPLRAYEPSASAAGERAGG